MTPSNPKSLSDQTCVPCHGGVSRLSETEIETLAPQVPQWHVIDENAEHHLQRTYSFKDFKTTLTFTLLVGAIAEEEGHHPRLLTEWGNVVVTWWTHAIGGLHENDFIMAAKTDQIALHIQKMAEKVSLPSDVGSSLATL